MVHLLRQTQRVSSVHFLPRLMAGSDSWRRSTGRVGTYATRRVASCIRPQQRDACMLVLVMDAESSLEPCLEPKGSQEEEEAKHDEGEVAVEQAGPGKTALTHSLWQT